MDILIDTNVLIRAVGASDRLNPAVKAVLGSPDNTIYYSAVSIWEIAIKFSLKRADFVISPDRVAEGAGLIGFIDIPLTVATAGSVRHLPLHHGDPFDRLLIAQALAGPMHFYTADAALAVYSDLVHIVR
jgi:PIN domain nuclease of toxin-antitoxin system